MVFEMELARKRFDCLVKALGNTINQTPDTFRRDLLTAYGCEDGVALGKWSSEEAAKIEKKFAQRCLEGVGPDENEATFDQANLCTVLAKEIGTQREDHKMFPWLGGDWITMAKLIIDNAERQLAGADDPKPADRVEPVDRIIRVWPIKRVVGNPVRLQKQGKHKICYQLEDTDKKIFLQTSGSDYQDYNWVILAEPPGKLTSKREEGLSENLWEGTEWDPGDDQER